MSNFDDRKKAINDLIAKAQEAIEKGDLETARNLKAEVDAAKKEFEELQKLSEEIEAAAPEQTEPEPEKAEEPVTEDNKEEETPAVNDAEKDEANQEGEETTPLTPETDDKDGDTPKPDEDDEDKEKDKKEKGAKRSMPKLGKDQETNEEILGFEEYMKSKGAKRDNVKSDDVGVTIPEDIKYIPEKEVNTVQDLSQLVQKTSVNAPSGKYPILKRANAKFNTVEELEKNPALARPEFNMINWEVATYRGAIPISQEALDDSVANLTSIVSENINEQKINTLNEKIGGVLKQFNPTTVSDVDDLKEIVNVKLDPGYDRQIICTQSFYQKLDTLK
ncbi:MAG: phage major capsid protein, partial [Tetragenococcus koreensis]|nr:phage major capsid protein [Tetragenococcus koreensis]